MEIKSKFSEFLQASNRKNFLAAVALMIFFILVLLAIVKFSGNLPLTALDNSPAARLIKSAASPTVYYVSLKGLKIPIPSAKVFLSYGNKWEQVEVVSDGELNFYRDAKYIKLIDQPAVYRLENNQKRFISYEASQALALDFSEVIVVNKTEFSEYSSGQPLSLSEATQIKLSQEQNLAEDRKTCTPDPVVGGDDGCLLYEALEKKDVNVCDSIQDGEWKAKCYSSVIPEGQDFLSNCKKILDEGRRYDCVAQVALAKNSSSVCEQIQDVEKKNFCAAQLGLANKDPQSCDKLTESGNEKSKSGCLYTYALLNSDMTACERIVSGSDYKQPCKDFVTKQVAFLREHNTNKATLAQNIEKFIYPKAAQALTGDITEIPVGGKFLPGIFDIYTPSLLCGILVSVEGPNPGLFLWLPAGIYNYFGTVPYHVGLNTLGLSRYVPGTPCPPTLFMLGSGATPI